jgi:hypothetical protein
VAPPEGSRPTFQPAGGAAGLSQAKGVDVGWAAVLPARPDPAPPPQPAIASAATSAKPRGRKRRRLDVAVAITRTTIVVRIVIAAVVLRDLGVMTVMLLLGVVDGRVGAASVRLGDAHRGTAKQGREREQARRNLS